MLSYYRFFLAFFIFVQSLGDVAAQVQIYPVPQGTALNPDFKVRINDGSGFKPVPVQDIVDVCFVQFAQEGSVKIEISVSEKIEKWKISPEHLGIEPEVGKRKLTFTLESPRKLIVLINENAGNHTAGLDGLCILAEVPENNIPDLSDSQVINILDYDVDPSGQILATTQIQKAFDDHRGSGRTIYFPPGIYKIGMLHMRSRQSLYLSPGAVLLGSADYGDYKAIPGEGNATEKYLLGSWKADGIRVFGRGIVNGNGTALRLQDPSGAGFKTHNIQFQGSSNVSIEGIISLDACSWSIEPIACDHLKISNVKVLSDLRYYDSKNNTDGINPNKCAHVRVDDCLIWSGDDAVSPKQDRTFENEFPARDNLDHRYSNITVFTRKCAVKIGNETWDAGMRMQNMHFKAFNVVFADRAMCIWSDKGALINEIVFRDFHIEKISKEYHQSHIHCRIDDLGNSIRNVNFINIYAQQEAPRGSTFNGNNLDQIILGEKVQYYDIRFRNYTIGGLPVLSLDDTRAKFNLEDENVAADPSAFSFSK